MIRLPLFDVQYLRVHAVMTSVAFILSLLVFGRNVKKNKFRRPAFLATEPVIGNRRRKKYFFRDLNYDLISRFKTAALVFRLSEIYYMAVSVEIRPDVSYRPAEFPPFYRLPCFGFKLFHEVNQHVDRIQRHRVVNRCSATTHRAMAL